MIQTIILIIFQILSIFFSVKSLKITNGDHLYKHMYIEILQLSVSLGFVHPLVEEIVFRYLWHTYISYCIYGEIIYALLFGLTHLLNYFVYHNKYIVIYHVISTAYLGYYLVQFDEFVYAFLIHSYYNLTVTLISYYLYWYLYVNVKNKQSIKDCVLMYNDRTVDDSVLYKDQDFRNSWKKVSRKQFSQDMLDRIDKYDQIILNRMKKTS